MYVNEAQLFKTLELLPYSLVGLPDCIHIKKTIVAHSIYYDPDNIRNWLHLVGQSNLIPEIYQDKSVLDQ